MTQTHLLAAFFERSSDKRFDDTELAKALFRLPSLAVKGPWLAGGALRRTLLGQPLDSDFDFFFRDATQLEGFELTLKSRGFTKVRETEHHVHYRGPLEDGGPARDIQMIRFRFYESAEEVIDSFDFTICQLAFDGLRLTCGEHALWDLGRKRLAVHKITYPVASMRRLLKYATQGFFACPGAMQALLRETIEKPALQAQFSTTYVD